MGSESFDRKPPERYFIGNLELDTGRISVTRGTTDIPLPKLSFDLLLCLARHAPNVVSTDTMMDEVWGQTVVGEETVKQRIKLLRQGLGDNSRDPVYFEAVRGRGYRMIADVSVPSGGDQNNRVREQLPGARKHPFVLAVLAVLLGILVAGAWFYLQPKTASEGSRRVAVLPFSFLGDQPQDDYIADGVTAEIITALTQLTNLPVIARTSVMQYKGSNKPISEIATELNVGTFIEGSIRRVREKLRISVQMINAKTEEHYWAKTFDVSLAELPIVQVELSEVVASSLASSISAIGRESILRNLTDAPEAWDFYLRGREAYRRWNRQDNDVALEFYQLALELDPGFALAIAGSANALALKATEFGGSAETVDRAIMEANRALSINPDLPEAHKALGIVSFYKGHFQAAIDHYQDALRLEPNFDEALFNLAETLHVLGRWDEAVRYQQLDSFRPLGRERLSIYLRDLGFFEEADAIATTLAAEIPVSFFSDNNLALHYLLGGQYEEARVHARRLQNFFPDSPAGWMWESDIELSSGDHSAAEQYAEIAAGKSSMSDNYAKLRLAQLLIERGETDRSNVLLEDVRTISQQRVSDGYEGWFYPWNLAFIYSLRGEREDALYWYEVAVKGGRRRFEWDEKESAFQLIANEPRFEAALQQQRLARIEMRDRVKDEIR